MSQEKIKKLAKKYVKDRMYEMSDVFFQSEQVKKGMIDMFVTGYKVSEYINNERRKNKKTV